MSINQLVRNKRKKRSEKEHLNRERSIPSYKGLKKKPQYSATIIKTTVFSPCKPNSAKRKGCIVRYKDYYGNLVKTKCYFSGEHPTPSAGSNSRVLITNLRTRDVRGLYKRIIYSKYYDAKAPKRVRSRSKYGVSEATKK